MANRFSNSGFKFKLRRYIKVKTGAWFLCQRRASRDAAGRATGGVTLAHRIRLPGRAILGEGKPENQNLGLAAGAYTRSFFGSTSSLSVG